MGRHSMIGRHRVAAPAAVLSLCIFAACQSYVSGFSASSVRVLPNSIPSPSCSRRCSGGFHGRSAPNSILCPTLLRRKDVSYVPVLASGGEGGIGGVGCNRKEGDPWWRGDGSEGSDGEGMKLSFLVIFAVLIGGGVVMSILGPLSALIYAATGIAMVVLGISATITWPFSREGKLVSDHMRIWSRIVLELMGVKYEVQGSENLDISQHYILVANHESLTDTALIYSLLPNRHIIAVGKKQLSYVPVFGWLMYLGGHIVVDRQNHESAMKSMERAEMSLRKLPRTVLVFPEGTRSRDGKLKPFKKGAFVLAIQTELPVVPMAVIGTGDLLKADKMAIRRKSKIRLIIGEPIKTKGMKYADRDKLCARVQKEVSKLREEGRKQQDLTVAV